MRTVAPRATLVLAAVTAAAYFLTGVVAPNGGVEAIGGFIPARVNGLMVPGALPMWLTPLSATLLHADPLHLGFNLLLLFFCGREDEVAIGQSGVLLLYGIGAYAAAGAQYLLFPRSTAPMIGASGAISALVGAYALLYGQRRASRLHPEVARWLHVLWLAATWIGLQLLVGVAAATPGVAVATAAHVGGFAVGLLIARPLLRFRYRNA